MLKKLRSIPMLADTSNGMVSDDNFPFCRRLLQCSIQILIIEKSFISIRKFIINTQSFFDYFSCITWMMWPGHTFNKFEMYLSRGATSLQSYWCPPLFAQYSPTNGVVSMKKKCAISIRKERKRLQKNKIRLYCSSNNKIYLLDNCFRLFH